MSKNINLLPKKNKPQDSHEELLIFFKRIATVTVIITIGSSLLFFLLTINPSFSAVKQQENNVLTNLSFTQGKIAKYVVIKNRLVSVAKILHTRYPMNAVVSKLEDQFPPDISIDSLEISNKTLSFSLTSASLLSLNTVITNMTSLLNSKNILKRITVQSIVSNPFAGTYTLTVHADLL